MKTYKKIYLLFLFSLCFGQNAELITQQITIEEAIKSKVDVVVSKFLQPSEYITIVNARLDFKPLALESAKEEEQVKSESNYSVIPGLMPSIPTRESIYKKNTGRNTSFDYSTEKYILYQLEIIIYLNEEIASGSLQNNIKTLVLQNLPEIDCQDCIRFESMDMPGVASGGNSDIKNLAAVIDSLKEQMRQGQLAIKDSQINDLEDINSQYLDQITEFQKHMQKQDSLRRAAEIARMERLESSEKLYREKQDSLYILTSIKLDEAVRGRIQSEETTKKELLNLIKMQIQGEESDIGLSGLSDNTQSDLFTKTPSMGKRGLSGQTWLMIVVLVLLMVVLLIMIMRNKQPIYLKPKGPAVVPDNNNLSSPQAPQKENMSFSETQANENEEVLRSELQSLRQSAVSMSVSEKTGANQIVQDWLDDGSSQDGDANQDLEEDNQNQTDK